MTKSKISTYLLFISLATLITTFVFIVQKSYDSLMKPINDAKQSVIIRPLDPNLDLSILDAIEKRGGLK